VDVVAVVHLGQVVERAGQLRERQHVAAAVVGDLDEALFDVDVGRPVLAHRPELDEVRVGGMVAHAPQQLQRPDDVVLLGLDGVVDALHRPRRAGLLAVVDDRVRLEVPHQVGGERALGEVADVALDVLAGRLLPGLDPLGQRDDGRQRVTARVRDPLPAGEIVGDGHLVAFAREPHGGRPAEIAVAAQDQDSHAHSVVVVDRLRIAGMLSTGRDNGR
jgi:hypothetical protein